MAKTSKPNLLKKSNLEPIVKEPKPTPPALTDEALVEKAFAKIKSIYLDHAQQAYLEIANYLLETFYDNNLELFRKKAPGKEKEESFNMLCDRLKEEDSRLPKKTWLYNCLRLLADEDELKKDTETFHTYGKFSVSHKVQLLQLRDPKLKKALIIEIDKENYSVRDVQKRVQELKPARKQKEGKKEIDYLNYHAKLESCLGKGKALLLELIDSSSDNNDEYKELYNRLDEIIKSANGIDF